MRSMTLGWEDEQAMGEGGGMVLPLGCGWMHSM